LADVPEFPRVSVEAAAAHLFIGVQRFRQLQREGVLPRATSSDWNIDAIRRRYVEHLRAVKGNHLSVPARGPRGGDGQPDLSVERALLAREQREGHALKNAVARGELIPASDVVEGWQSAIARARSLLLGLPTSAADELVLLAARGPAAVRERLAELIHGALAELADTAVEDAGEVGA
jgi:phage terminase Nu1 subunit (DNA packaging protein)